METPVGTAGKALKLEFSLAPGAYATVMFLVVILVGMVTASRNTVVVNRRIGGHRGRQQRKKGEEGSVFRLVEGEKGFVQKRKIYLH